MRRPDVRQAPARGAQRACDERGRGADSPPQISWRGWWDVALRVKDQVRRDNVSLIAAGLALYALLAVFPAMSAVVALYGWIASPEQITEQLGRISVILPAQVSEFVQRSLTELAAQRDGALSFGTVFGFVLALWSARKGMAALMTASNVAYDEQEDRGMLRQLFVSLAFTLGAVVSFVLVVLLAVAAPIAIESIGLGTAVAVLSSVLRWVLLWALVVIGLAVVYRFAPDRDEPQWRWVSWGSAIAATSWLVGSVLFSLYVRSFGAYGQTYGALAGVVVLLLWFYLSAFVVVLGAEINSELERQTRRDTTQGSPSPMGTRGAHAADTLGRSANR